METEPKRPSRPVRAPRGTLSSYQRERFEAGRIAHDVYRKGHGPAVLVLSEMPGITSLLLGFADRVVALGCTAVVPDLFGDPCHRPRGGALGLKLHTLAKLGKAICIQREFATLAAGRTGPVVDWLRALAEQEHARAGGPGVGVVGMCFSGGLALAMAVDPRVLAPVLAEPSLPLPLHPRARAAIDCGPQDLVRVRTRCERDGLTVLGLRFRDDPFVPAERFASLRAQLGEAFVAVELDQADGHPDSMMPVHHSVLTHDLIDEAGQPTRAALDRVLAHLRSRLLSAS